MCLCVGNEIVEVVPVGHGVAAMKRASELSLQVGDTVTRRQRYQGQVLGLEAGTSALRNRIHSGDPAASPAPSSAPSRPWVVETGIPMRVATKTVSPAPRPTAAA